MGSEKLLNSLLVVFFIAAIGFAGYLFLVPEKKVTEVEIETLQAIQDFTKPLKANKSVDVREVLKKPIKITAPKPVAKNSSAKPKVESKLKSPPRVRRHPPGLDPKQVYFKVIEGGYAVSFGDVIIGKLGQGQQRIEEGAFEPQRPQLWPSPQIPYQVAEGVDISIVKQALDYFEANTPIRFVPLTAEDKNGIVFMPTKEHCASLLGMVSGIQPILLSKDCDKGQVLHEIMHALGFVHEHSRVNRDQYLKINWDNIKPAFLAQFNIIPDTLIHNYSGSVFEFDYESIMLYPESAFAKTSSKKTLESRTTIPVRPRREELSRIDKERVFYLYGY